MIQQPTNYKIKKPKLYGEVKKKLAQIWGLDKKLVENPAPVSVALNRERMKLLNRKDYVVLENTTGVWYLLLLSRFSGTKRPFAALIDCDFNMFQIEVFAPTAMFDDTLLHGKLCIDTKGMFLKYFAYDLVCVKGQCCRKKDFIERYTIINQLFPAASEWNTQNDQQDVAQLFAEQGKIVVVPDHQNRIIMYSKQCVAFDFLGSLSRMSITHETDGFLFMPIKPEIQSGTHERMFHFDFKSVIDLKYYCGFFFCKDGKDDLKLNEAFPNCKFEFQLNNNSFDLKIAFILSMSITCKNDFTFVLNFETISLKRLFAHQLSFIKESLNDAKEKITMDELLELSISQV